MGFGASQSRGLSIKFSGGLFALTIGCTQTAPTDDSADELGTTSDSSADTSESDSSDTAPGDGGTEGDSTGDSTGETGDEDPPTCDPDAERPDVSNPPEGAAWRYGGGAGYPDLVDPDCATAVVATFAELEAALESAVAGDSIYVEDSAAIDLTGASLCIPGGVTLASGRGREGSAGGLLYATVTETAPVLRACGSDVRVTGLRIRGSDPSQCPPEYPDNCEGPLGTNCRDCMPRSYGISCRENDRLEVDNCEVSGWTAAAISVVGSVDHHVHHNHLHHTQREGLGYGVVLGRIAELPTTVVVEWNRFDYNRHAIAASGELAQDYVARNNLVLAHANGHVFDAHGQNENTDDGTPWAGGDIRIHDNTVMVPDRYSVVIRGRPHVGAWIWDNCLAPANPAAAFLQKNYFGNFYVDEDPDGVSAQNAYGQAPSACQTTRFCFEPGGIGPQHPLSASSFAVGSLGFGDFDGDGTTDILRTDGSQWLWLSAGKGSWAPLNTSSATLAELRFGDFDGDGTTDVFSSAGGQWRYSQGGNTPWMPLRTANETVTELRFGDFDGDGTTDVLKADGTNWWVSAGGSDDWVVVNTSGMLVAAMRIGDFDGDGRDDVFSANGNQWRFSSGADSAWANLSNSSVPLSGLRLADLDGDGRTDVLRVSGDRRVVVWAGQGSWEVIGHGSESLAEFGVGDFDGDGRDDLFRAGCY